MTELALAVFASETGTHLLRPPLNRRWSSHLRSFDAHAYEQRLAARGLRFLPRTAPAFPPLLRAIHDPPPGLFLRGEGELALLSRAAVAVVGARACSGYGASVARSLGRELARAGLVVVSGLARGVDAEAHRGALEAGGPTVAVLGCGIDRDYPAAHAELARRDRRDRAARLRVRARRRARAVAVPRPQPDRRRPLRARPSSSRRASAAARSSPPTSHSRRAGRCSPSRARSARASPRARTRCSSSAPPPLTAAADVLAVLRHRRDRPPRSASALLDLLPATADELVRRTGRPAAEIAQALVELELAGAAAAHDGIYRVQ